MRRGIERATGTLQRLALATYVWRVMKTSDSRECRSCHAAAFMDLSAQETRAARLHQEALANGGTCIDCHSGIAHALPAGAEEAAKKLWESLGHRWKPIREQAAAAR